MRLILAKLWPHPVLYGSVCVFSGIGILDDCLDASPSHSPHALCARGLLCGYLDTGNPDYDIDHGDPSHGYLDHGAPSSALGYLDIDTKGYHLA